MEPLIGEMSRLLTRDTVYSRPLLVLLSRALDSGDGSFQLVIHFAVEDWMADVVAKVEGTDEERVDSCFSDCVDLCDKAVSMNFIKEYGMI